MNEFERRRGDVVYNILKSLEDEPLGLSSISNRLSINRGFIEGVLEGARRDGFVMKLGKKYALTSEGESVVDTYRRSIDQIVGD